MGSAAVPNRLSGPFERGGISAAGRWVRLVVALALIAMASGALRANGQGATLADATRPGEAAPSPPTVAEDHLDATAALVDRRRRTFDAVVDVFAAHYWNAGYRDWALWGARYRDAALAAESRVAFDAVLHRMIADLGDEHSRWIGRTDDADHALPPDRRPRLGLRASFLPGHGLVIERVFPGSPAAAAGLERGDVVESVAGRDLRASDAERAQVRLEAAAERGAARLGLRRGRRAFAVTVAAEPLDAVVLAARPEAHRLTPRTGYLYVPGFQAPDTAREAHHLIERLTGEGVEALVLDLRGNPGGRITEMGLLLGAFLDGPLAEAVSRDAVAWRATYRSSGTRGVARLERDGGGEVVSAAVDGAVRFGGELVVLVDERSSSAAELAAAILQRRGRARVVGVPTAGNVEAVRGFDLPDGSLVMVAVANLRAVGGESYSEGIAPDVYAREDIHALARGFDAPVAEAVRLLEAAPFVEGRYF